MSEIIKEGGASPPPTDYSEGYKVGGRRRLTPDALDDHSRTPGVEGKCVSSRKDGPYFDLYWANVGVWITDRVLCADIALIASGALIIR